jgi:hypothetical protein
MVVGVVSGRRGVWAGERGGALQMRNPRKVRSVMGCEDSRQLSEPGEVVVRACCSRSMVVDRLW